MTTHAKHEKKGETKTWEAGKLTVEDLEKEAARQEAEDAEKENAEDKARHLSDDKAAAAAEHQREQAHGETVARVAQGLPPPPQPESDLPRVSKAGKSVFLFEALEVNPIVGGGFKPGRSLGVFETREELAAAAKSFRASGGGKVYLRELSLEEVPE
jgi:hypothetical protein